MDFIEDESRPKFLFHSKPLPSSAPEPQTTDNVKTPLTVISISLSLLLFALSFFYDQPEPFKSLLVWLSLSLLVGPFAPPSITGGDIRVGQGRIVEFPPEDESIPSDESKKKSGTKRQKGRRSDEQGLFSIGAVNSNSEFQKIDDLGHNSTNRVNGSVKSKRREGSFEQNGNGSVVEEREWTEEDIELLRKQVLKHPVGKPRRWEVISEAFNGRHSVQSVIKMSKSMGEAKPEDADSYSKFLRNRKPVDKRAVESGEGELIDGGGDQVNTWSSGEDIALLNALKAFPKDVPMRWEKIAAAVPGKTKNACVKRVAELKRGFRSSKAATASDS